MDRIAKSLCIGYVVLSFAVNSASPCYEKSVGAGPDKFVAREQPDHTHRDHYEYEHIQPQNRITLSSTMALNNHYGDLARKVQQAGQWDRLLKILDEE